MTDSKALDQLCINTIRTLSIDAVQKAKSGHPGTPMGAAPIAYCLWQRFLRYDPGDSKWANRDRFVLSNGHACMLLYSLLFLASVKPGRGADENDAAGAVTLEDIKTFRQAGSRCTGHPEYGVTAGVEVTTGPLGQGVANSVGMAIAGRWLAARYNRPDFPLFDHKVYALCSDGDMMEGISDEAASLAAHLRLSNLCWIYDSNRVTIEGSTDLAFTEDVASRFLAYGWNVVRVGDANDLDRLNDAYRSLVDTHDRPTFIIIASHIGYGSPHKHDSAQAHGEALGEDEVRLAKRFYGWDPDAQFLVPDGVMEHFDKHLGQRGGDAHAAWERLFERYRTSYASLGDELLLMQRRALPAGWDLDLPVFAADPQGVSTRDASGKVLNAVAPRIPWLIGGAADLASSTKTRLTFDGAGDFQATSYGGRNFHFGVREHALCAIASGMALCGVRPYTASFLIFTDYARRAIRLSAMMELPVITIWTHDSISLGEDGPTHQPVEHLASLRAMPRMVVLRPADGNEVVEAYRASPADSQPPGLPGFVSTAIAHLRSHALRGGERGRPRRICSSRRCRRDAGGLVACHWQRGRPVRRGLRATHEGRDQGARGEHAVVGAVRGPGSDIPRQVLPPQVAARVAVEEASSFGWTRYVGASGTVLGLDTFGMSAPVKVVQRHFGFEPARVVAAAKEQLYGRR